MKEFYKELSKHYLGIAAAILIALIAGYFLKDLKFNLLQMVVGILIYFTFIVLSFLFFKHSKNYGEKKNV
jgi:Ca2+/Na+ antiporter